MKEVVKVTSDLFDSCKNCKSAEDHGKDEINRVLSPSLDDPEPPKPSEAVAVVKCFHSGGDVSAGAEITLDGESSSGSTGPISCPTLEVKK